MTPKIIWHQKRQGEFEVWVGCATNGVSFARIEKRRKKVPGSHDWEIAVAILDTMLLDYVFDPVDGIHKPMTVEQAKERATKKLAELFAGIEFETENQEIKNG